VLGGPWYGDGLRAGMEARETIEQTQNIWIGEIGELAGMATRDVERIKDYLSRQTDRARKSYGRLTSTVPRQWIAIGTTNSDAYLRDPTGNRRFLPVKIGKVDLEALKRDRDQLWAEAVWWAENICTGAYEVPKALWDAAATAQEQRRVVTPIEERLIELVGHLSSGRVSKELLWRMLDYDAVRSRSQTEANAMTAAMARMGWASDRQRDPNKGSNRTYCYSKVIPGEEPKWLADHNGELLYSDDPRLEMVGGDPGTTGTT
jgi:predicted P-loop ATPase